MILNKVLPDVIKDWQDDLPITGIIVISLISISDIPVRRISQPGHRFGFFPAISGAWNIAEESLIKKHLKWMNMFKIRYSYGKVGNDNLGNTRFPYLYDIETMTKKDGDKTVDTGGYNFGDYTFDRYYGGMRYSSLSSPNVTWEIATKHDLGIDFSFFNDKLSGSVDLF